MSESRMRENLTYGLMRGQRVKPLAYSTEKIRKITNVEDITLIQYNGEYHG